MNTDMTVIVLKISTQFFGRTHVNKAKCVNLRNVCAMEPQGEKCYDKRWETNLSKDRKPVQR